MSNNKKDIIYTAIAGGYGEIMQPPLFSVLIANYNNGKYLMDAIKSGRWKLEKRPLVRIFIQ